MLKFLKSRKYVILAHGIVTLLMVGAYLLFVEVFMNYVGSSEGTASQEAFDDFPMVTYFIGIPLLVVLYNTLYMLPAYILPKNKWIFWGTVVNGIIPFLWLTCLVFSIVLSLQERSKQKQVYTGSSGEFGSNGVNGVYRLNTDQPNANGYYDNHGNWITYLDTSNSTSDMGYTDNNGNYRSPHSMNPDHTGRVNILGEVDNSGGENNSTTTDSGNNGGSSDNDV